MTSHGGRERRFLSAFSQFFALLTMMLGVLGLLGWIFARPLLSSYAAGLIPMAPSTAVLFTLLGAGVLCRSRFPQSRATHWTSAALACVALVTALPLFLLSYRGIYLDIERLGIAATGTIVGAPIGHMSPVTALLFICASSSFLTALTASQKRGRGASVALWIAFASVLGSYVLILAYLFGWPLLYGGQFIPPALPTSFSFAALGTALSAFARIQAVPHAKSLPGPAIRGSYALTGLFVTLALSIITGGYLHYNKTEHQHRLDVERQLSAIAELKVHDLERWRKERLGDANVLYRNAAFYELARRYFETPGDLQLRDHLQTWLYQIQQSYHYDRVYLLDTHGAERISAPSTPEVASPLSRDVSTVLDAGELTFVDFHRDAEGQGIHLAVMVPILDEQNSKPPIGVLALRIDPRQYLYPHISRWPAQSATAETLLVRRDGNEVLFLNELRFQKGAALALREPLDKLKLPAVQAVLGHEGVVEGIDYRGVPVLAVVRAVPDTPWHLVARVDLDEVYAPMRERFIETVVLIAVLLLCAAAGITLIWRHQRIRFYKEGYEIERERAWLQDVISRSLNEVFVFDPDTLRFTFANAGACRNLGYSLEELGRLTPVDIKPEFTLESFRASVQPLRSTGSDVLVFETVHRRKNGTLYPVEVHLQHVETAGKAVFLAIINDITERKRAETAIRRLNRVYAVLSDINQAIVRTRNIQELFEKSCQIAFEKGDFPLVWIGLLDESCGELRPVASAGEFGGYLEEVRLPLYEEARHDCPVDAALRDAKPVVCNDIGASGSTAPCQQNAVRFGLSSCASFPLRVSGAVRGVITFYARESEFFDDDELKLLDELSMDLSFAMEFANTEGGRTRAEAALQDSVKRYRHLVDSSPMSIFVNRNGRIDYINPAGLTLFGASSETQIIGKTPLDIFHPDYHDAIRARIRRLTHDQRTVPLIEEKIVRLDGATRDVEVVASLFTDNEGDAIQVILNDITDRKNLEAQLNHARKMEAVGQLAGGVAHDFNNVLQAIMGCTQLLVDSPQTTDQQRELLAEIHTGAERAATLTRQLLAFSRRQVMRPGVLDLNCAIGDLLKMLRRVIGEHIRLDFLQGSHLGSVYADRTMIEQVIMNLCVNARDAMPGGGILTIETETVRIDSEYCATHLWAKPGRYILLSVTDTGCGMDAATIERIFDPFFTTKEEGKGTGLGLATVYGIVKQHDGMISAYSEIGKGTTFKIYLPLCERDAETVGSKITGIAIGGTETILLAEDDEAVRRLAQRILERAGYTVLAATDGEEAVALFKHTADRIDLLLFDVVMPNLGGHDAYEQIHALRPNMPILFSSGYSENAVHTNFVLHEDLELIQKPYARDDLLRAVRRVLERPRRP